MRIRMLVHSVLFLFLTALAPVAGSSTLLNLDIATLSREAEAIVAAEVISRETVRTSSGALRTRVLMRVDRVVAGAAPPKLELGFLGGELGDTIEAVAGFEIPRVGETAVYFVASLSRPMIVPLLGWDQGRFLLRRDANGVERLFTAQGKPVLSLDSSRRAKGLSSGVASGVAVGIAAQNELAMTLDDFATAIRTTRGAVHAPR